MSEETGTGEGLTAAAGFRAAAVRAGVAGDRLDLAVVVSDRPASAAAVFTRNRVVAAPVVVSREHLEATGGRCRAVVVNAGNANACTGEEGLRAARTMASETGRLLGVEPREVLVASTGVIGQRLPVERIVAALPEAVGRLSAGGHSEVAKAILTTDTVTKEATCRLRLGGSPVVVGGVAKGSGMIHPDLATTLAFVTTDAVVAPDRLRECLVRAADATFNAVTVDGDTSTNDMVAVLANGASGAAVEGRGAADFEAALQDVLESLARQVARDGEGATRLVTVEVVGAADDAEARRAARTVAGSPLVKTAVHGADANWGRVVAAVGRADVKLNPERLAVWFGDVRLAEGGRGLDFSEEDASHALEREEVEIRVDLGVGEGSGRAWGCDLSPEYVRINASYRS